MRLFVAVAATLLAACVSRPPSSADRVEPSFDIHKIATRELLREANHGREIAGADGRFVLPRGVQRVWIDVGANLLQTTQGELQHKDVAIVAIEPLAECWKAWPDNPRLIALPVAISTERGWLDFHVNAANVTSSLLKSAEGTSVGEAMRTVEVRKVPVLRLEDILERIPPGVPVEYLKTDVQGLDLQVLKSAGERLRRVETVKAEVINERFYEGTAALQPGTEDEFVAYMQGKGFRFEGDSGVADRRAWLDKHFVNQNRAGWLGRTARRIRSVFS